MIVGEAKSEESVAQSSLPLHMVFAIDWGQWWSIEYSWKSTNSDVMHRDYWSHSDDAVMVIGDWCLDGNQRDAVLQCCPQTWSTIERGWVRSHCRSSPFERDETDWQSLMSEAVAILPVHWLSCLEWAFERVHWRPTAKYTTNEIDLPNGTPAKTKTRPFDWCWREASIRRITHVEVIRFEVRSVIVRSSADERGTGNKSRMRATSSRNSSVEISMRLIVIEDECILNINMTMIGEECWSVDFIQIRHIYREDQLSPLQHGHNSGRGQRIEQCPFIIELPMQRLDESECMQRRHG